ncbi:MAG: TfoX/Sxy family protein [Thermoplasmatota archaeon]
MGYDEGLAERIADCLPAHATERKMFGGICYLDRGNMACGIVDDKLMLRLSKELAAEYRKEPHTAPMDFTGRPMPSMMYVEAEGIADDSQLRMWVDRAFAFTKDLPAK